MAVSSSTVHLRDQIEEDLLTCSICCGSFTRPRALPCLHTYCEECLTRYLVENNFMPTGVFPCPVCRTMTTIPPTGVTGFPYNHMVETLADTVEKSRSNSQNSNPTKPVPAPRRGKAATGQESQAAETKPASGFLGKDVQPPPVGIEVSTHSPFQLPSYQSLYPGHYRVQPTAPPLVPDTNAFSDSAFPGTQPLEVLPSTGLYPQLPPEIQEKVACTERLLRRFGHVTLGTSESVKVVGLAVSHQGEFVVSERRMSKIHVFDRTGRPLTQFRCPGCMVNDVTISPDNNILVAVSKCSSAILRKYSMTGKLLGEFGSHYRFEQAHGVACLPEGWVAITGVQGHCIYVLTDQYKLSTKLGRKGTGDDHFLCPGYVATNMKSHIIVSDTQNNYIQVYKRSGQFKYRFGTKGSQSGGLLQPRGLCTDRDSNIIVADSGNFRVEMFNNRGGHIGTVVTNTNLIGPGVQPVAVAMTPENHVAVLLVGDQFVEVRVYALPQTSGVQVPTWGSRLPNVFSVPSGEGNGSGTCYMQ